MTIPELFDGSGIPIAYDHFAEGEAPDPPFICYLIPGSDSFSADDSTYYRIDQIHLELYTDYKDIAAEWRVEKILREAGIPYQKSEVWIEEEKLYEILYRFEQEALTEQEERSITNE